MSEIDGLRIMVTGGASGMGEAMVKDFARHGARVVSLDITDEAGAVIAAEAGASYIHCDVSDEASVGPAFEQAVRQLGGLDVLVHAAGIAPGAPAEAITLSGWEKVFAVNARGTFLTNQAAFAHLKDHGGRIINFASAAGITGLPNKAHYAATKGAVIAWTRTVAKEWGQYGITVNCKSQRCAACHDERDDEASDPLRGELTHERRCGGEGHLLDVVLNFTVADG